jgi:hypothetical protein
MRVPQVNERVKEAPAHALRAMFAGIGQLLSVTDKLRGKSGQTPATAETTAEAAKVTAANGAEAAPDAVVTTETVTVETPAPETTAAAAVVVPAAAAAAAPAEAAVVAPAAEPGTVTPDATPAGGNVKLISPEKPASEPAVSAEPAPAAAEVPEAAAAAAEVPEAAEAAVPAEAPEAEPAAAEAAVSAEAAVTEVTSAADLPLANYDSLTVASLRARLRNLSVAQLNQLIGYEKAHAARADVIAMFERRIAKLESES